MSTAVRSMGLDEMVAATPDKRDRYMDFLRALSIAVVVFGHWLMAIVYFDGKELSGDSALLVVPGTWLLTWVLQVMPLFFFVGGFSNLTSWRSIERKGGGYSEFITGRVDRLMRPTSIFIGAWLAIAVALQIATPGYSSFLQPALAVVAKPLWFIAVYLLVVALAPVMISLHHRFGARVLGVMVASAAAIDVLRIVWEVPVVGYLNFAFVWLFAHHLGFFYADGSLGRLGRKANGLIALGGLALTTVLVAFGPYSASMVGIEDGRVSNNDPPSICIMALTMWLVGLAMLGRDRITAALERPRNWKLVIAANSMIMTIFLWHLSALLIAVLVFYPLGFPQPAGGTAMWWATRPLWMALLTVLLVPFVLLFGRFERPRGATKSKSMRLGRVGLGIGTSVAGISGIATGGFAIANGPGPVGNALLAAVGVTLLRATSGLPAKSPKNR